MSKKKRIAKRLGLGLLLVLAAGAIFEQIGARLDRGFYPERGERIDIGDGRRVLLDCRGQGSPAVILEAGHNGWSPAWTVVQPRVATFTRVCSYDRAGLGQSDAGPRPRDAAAVVGDLERLLERGHVEPPYVLVGHSAGGMYQRLYFAKHPERVAGMVLVDTDEPTDAADRQEVADAPDDHKAGVLLTAAVYSGVFRLLNQVFGVEPGPPETARYPIEFKVRMRGELARLGPAMNDEWKLYQSAYATVTDVPLGARPLAVIGALGYLKSDADKEDRRARQKRLAALSSRSTLVVLDDEAHFLPLLRPDLVTEAIHGVVGNNPHP